MTFTRISSSLKLAAGILVGAVAVRYAQRTGILSAEAATRAIQIIIGLIVAVYANAMPKDIGRWRSPASALRVQSALRVGGWSLTLAGLAYAGLWAFAPFPFASTWAIVVVATATAVTAAYSGWTYVMCRRANHLTASR